MLSTDNFALESVAQMPFSLDSVYVVFIDELNVNVGFLNKPKPAGLMLMEEKSCPTAPMALPIAMLFAVPW